MVNIQLYFEIMSCTIDSDYFHVTDQAII